MDYEGLRSSARARTLCFTIETVICVSPDGEHQGFAVYTKNSGNESLMDTVDDSKATIDSIPLTQNQ